MRRTTAGNWAYEMVINLGANTVRDNRSATLWSVNKEEWFELKVVIDLDRNLLFPYLNGELMTNGPDVAIQYNVGQGPADPGVPLICGTPPPAEPISWWMTCPPCRRPPPC